MTAVKRETKPIIKLSPLAGINIGRGLLFCALNNALLKFPFFHRSIADQPARETEREDQISGRVTLVQAALLDM